MTKNQKKTTTKKKPTKNPTSKQRNPKLKKISVAFIWIGDLCCLVVMPIQGRWLECVEHVAPFGLGSALNWLKQSMKLHLYLYVQCKLFKEGAVFKDIFKVQYFFSCIQCLQLLAP